MRFELTRLAPIDFKSISLTTRTNCRGPLRESNPGPLAPKARIIPLDQAANAEFKFHNFKMRFQ
jgi:hypothetical protein